MTLQAPGLFLMTLRFHSSQVVRAALPLQATFGRLGGEEFACVIEGCGLGEAVRIDEDLSLDSAA